MNEKENFCRNVKKLRANNFLTKTEMARKLKISMYTLNKIESGELPRRLTVEIIYAIVDEFDIKAEDLFNDVQ